MIFKSFIILCTLIIFNNVEGFGVPKPKYVVKEKVIPQPEITKVHLIFMNHLDVGYSDYVDGVTGFSANVLNSYFNVFFPRAIALARQMKSDGYVEQFRYTTHAWLLHMFIHCPPNMLLANILVQCPNATSLSSMIQAIKDGDILWHDGPMNMNYENMNAFGLSVALNISANLNKQFGIYKPVRVISLRDVPGLTRGVIRILLANNVFGITCGVNSGSAPPAVPPLSRWKAPPRSNFEDNTPDIVLMQNPFGYPDPPGPNPNNPMGISAKNCHKAPGSTEVLCFMFRSDNNGPPQSVQEVLSTYEILRARYVNAQLVAGRFEDFFTIAYKNRHLLPVVDQELGDTWIQGTASDPKKFARYRSMQRQFEIYYKSGQPITQNVVYASAFLIKPAEHTYGLSDCGDSMHWSNEQFKTIRQSKGVINAELSWVEQREYEDVVLSILGSDHLLTKNILAEWKEMEDFDKFADGNYQLEYKNFESKKSSGSYNFTCSNKTHSIVVGFQDGAITYLPTKNIRISSMYPLGQMIYNTYNESDTDFWLKYYKTTWNTGYGKPNSTINAHPESKDWNIILRSIYRKADSDCSFLLIVSPENSTASSYYGFPEEVFIAWDINIENDEISTEVFWDRKNPTRLMEAISFSFKPYVPDSSYQWFLSKMNEPISPYSVILNGSQWQHNVDDSGVFIASAPNAPPIFQVIPWDTGITCPITAYYGPTVWPAPLYPITDRLTGVAFNFYNNVWNTNYIYWYPYHGKGTVEDTRFKGRFTTKVSMITTKIDDTLRFY